MISPAKNQEVPGCELAITRVPHPTAAAARERAPAGWHGRAVKREANAMKLVLPRASSGSARHSIFSVAVAIWRRKASRPDPASAVG